MVEAKRGAGPTSRADLWSLDPGCTFLNHGSFGACPRAIVERQRELQDELERQPVDFLDRELAERLEAAREALAAFVGADPGALAFVANATSGVNTVVRSLDLREGDELLTTDHAYPACRKALEYAAARAGARVTVAAVPFPLDHEDEIVAAVLAAATPRTRLVLIDHVTSPTGLVFPVERLVRELGARGVDVFVDGAHALGMVPIDLGRIGAAYYTGNAHKWLCAPKGSAFLFVRADRQRGVHPLTISHGYDPGGRDARFRAEFDWTGTLDPTPWLVVPDCIRFLGGLLPGGWPALMETNRALALAARRMVTEAIGVPEPCPEEMIAALASVPLPGVPATAPIAGLDAKGIAAWVRERGIESWFHPWPCGGGALVRVSAQLYNTEDQFRALAALLREAIRGA